MARSPNDTIVRGATPADRAAWTRMRESLGPEWLTDDFDAIAAEYFDRGTIQGLRHVVLIAEQAGTPVGFAEVSLREIAEGCLSSPVGYLEGWLVADEARGMGVGSALVAAGERWAAAQGCTEFASDAELDNEVSLRAHAALGFEGVCEIRCFRKSIDAAP
ncbi:MAG: GNAT family N-acetyltransferase [Phycisphaerales bacterium JB041]